MHNAIILQQCFSSGEFVDMQRLTMMRHSAYARAYEMDYWLIMGDYPQEIYFGGWGKIQLILDALNQGYKHVFWIDSDAAIMDFSTDLRDALRPGGRVGAVEHNAGWFKAQDIPPHLNVGVMYFNLSDITKAFCTEWLHRYPGDRRWLEQGAFNDLIKEPAWRDAVVKLDARWNATVNVNEVGNPVVKGWHGVMPWGKRTDLMRAELSKDFIQFKP